MDHFISYAVVIQSEQSRNSNYVQTLFFLLSAWTKYTEDMQSSPLPVKLFGYTISSYWIKP